MLLDRLRNRLGFWPILRLMASRSRFDNFRSATSGTTGVVPPQQCERELEMTGLNMNNAKRIMVIAKPTPMDKKIRWP